ncbi:hypothetical protein AK812_SmicGene32289 [Symbiodinium microadriaticum]|uniref:Uncharacterized protein n=1 Tax=Symbiodinium microadriaticum TaxID=2951 RepID=A0A1Q9CUJ6_SYMMI|nr:hypothetical protein AK812_SmicGene32289 [Symbiodinium microadriaticum]
MESGATIEETLEDALSFGASTGGAPRPEIFEHETTRSGQHRKNAENGAGATFPKGSKYHYGAVAVLPLLAIFTPVFPTLRAGGDDVAKEVLKMRDEEAKLRENMKATDTGA